jgi:hypothetical protein
VDDFTTEHAAIPRDRCFKVRDRQTGVFEAQYLDHELPLIIKCHTKGEVSVLDPTALMTTARVTRWVPE